jgi:predicted small metal-binding protein
VVARPESAISLMARQYECLEAGCGATIVAAGEEALVEAVQQHMADRHGSFELEDVIIDMSTVVDEGKEEEL